MKDSQSIISVFILVGIIIVVTLVSMAILPEKMELKQAINATPQPSNNTTKKTPVPTITAPARPYTTPASPTNSPTTLPSLTPIPNPVLPPPNYPTLTPIPAQSNTPNSTFTPISPIPALTG